MTRVFALFGVLCALVGGPARGDASDAALRDADLAWRRGDYVTALNGYLKVLASSDDERLLEQIALQTGELYLTLELTADGSAPRFSPDGRHIAYESAAGARRITRLVDTEKPTTIKAELQGSGAAFSPDGSHIIYLKLVASRELEEAQVALERATTPAARAQHLAALSAMTAAATRIVVRDLGTGHEADIDTANLRKSSPLLAAGGVVLFTGTGAEGATEIYAGEIGGQPRRLTGDPGAPDKALLEINATGTAALYRRSVGGAGRGGGSGGVAPTFGHLTLPEGKWSIIEGSAPSFSADGRSFIYLARTGDESRLLVASTVNPTSPTLVRKGLERIDAPALSRDGSRIAFQMMSRDDWELFVINRDGTAEIRVTREIQHDVLPRFLTADRLLGLIGEPRHRRSYIYDLAPSLSAPSAASSPVRTRVFHNNTIRTIAPEYLWVPSPDGTRILISAERDGDTVSAERGIYLVDLSRRVTRDELRSRLTSNLTVEQALIAKGKRLYAPIAPTVREVLNDASVARVFEYEQALYDFDSKHISRPGNKLASAYLFETYKSFGYQPQYQWFEVGSALGGQTANVIATLKGTVNPELVYIVSSHYDSVASGSGADDNSSGTAALLEAARILARHPQPATIIFASFTGEESGLLGSREFVRRAVADKVRVVGALNNDMIGWANDHRLDNTIRYSNPGIRDIQHAAAMQFTNLITYDALYYKGTDAAAYYDTYGDIVGGIGSYPVLGNPHYHQSHDNLETINHQLVTEVAKTTAATLMLLASSPSRLTELTVDAYRDGIATLSWRPSPETGVTGYLVAYGPPDRPESHQMTVKKPGVTIKAAPGWVVSVKGVNPRGLVGWDSARIYIGGRAPAKNSATNRTRPGVASRTSYHSWSQPDI